MEQNQAGAAEMVLRRETEKKTCEGNAVIKRSSVNIWEDFNVASRKTLNRQGAVLRQGCGTDQTGSPSKMYDGVFNQSKMAYSSGVDCNETVLVHNVFSFERSQAVISSKKNCNNVILSDNMIQNTDLLIVVIAFLPNHSIITAMWWVRFPSKHLSPNNVVECTPQPAAVSE